MAVTMKLATGNTTNASGGSCCGAKQLSHLMSWLILTTALAVAKPWQSLCQIQKKKLKIKLSLVDTVAGGRAAVLQGRRQHAGAGTDTVSRRPVAAAVEGGRWAVTDGGEGRLAVGSQWSVVGEAMPRAGRND